MQVIFHWDGDLIQGSLISGFDDDSNKNIYGVNEHGTAFTTWKDNGVIKFATIPETQDIVPGSLVLGTGNYEAPGVYGATTDENIINFYWGAGGWISRTTSWGKVVSGSLVLGGISIYGVSPEGYVFHVRQVDDELAYWPVLEEFDDVVPGSLCYGGSSWVADTPGLYGVNINGKIVNYRWAQSGWDRRTTIWGGDALAGSLIRGDIKMYGVDPLDRIVAAWQQNDYLNYAIITIGDPMVIEEIDIDE